MNDAEYAAAAKELCDKLTAALNSHQSGPISIKIDALAHVSAWMMLHIGGPEHFEGIHKIFQRSMLSAVQQVCDDPKLQAQVEGVSSDLRRRAGL